MSPHIHSPAGARYRVVVTQISDHGAEVTFDHTAQAYIAAVADLSGTRITATVDHDGDLTLRQRLAVYITLRHPPTPTPNTLTQYRQPNH